MKFVNPGFLFALISIAIPIIIHLFNFRKFKQVYFTNVRFLKEVKQETQSRSKLKHLLVLLARILAITFLVLAFAQPFIPVDQVKTTMGNNMVSVYIDNSFSMDAMNKNGTLLTAAKSRAKEIVNAYKATDRFQLITNNFEGRHQRLVNKEDMLELIEEVNTSANVRKTDEVIARQQDLLLNNEEGNRKIYYLSDFQKSTTNINTLKPDSAVSINLVPILSQQSNNLFIDTCWITSPVAQLNKNIELYVRIQNLSDKAVENNPVKLFVNGQPKTPASYNVESNSSTEVVLTFSLKETGVHNCRVELNDYPVSFDDVFYFTLTVNATIPMLVVNGEDETTAKYLHSLFSSDSLFKLKESGFKNIDYSAFPRYQLIVLNGLNEITSGLAQELKRFVSNGGSLLVFPSDKIDVNSYKDLSALLGIAQYEKQDTANTRVNNLNFELDIYKGVFEKENKDIDLPAVNSHYRINSNSRIRESILMKMQNGNIFMAAYPSAEGKVYLSSVSLNSNASNFPKHAVFVPTLYQIALFSSPQPVKLFYTIGNNEPIEINNKTTSTEAVYSILNNETKFEAIPESKSINFKTYIYPNNQVSTANNYLLKYGTEIISGLAFNYNRNESFLTTYTPEELQQQIAEANISNVKLVETGDKSLTDVLSEKNQGKKLWKLCIILALLFLATEIVLLRFLKN